jgi:hypothetical protein
LKGLRPLYSGFTAFTCCGGTGRRRRRARAKYGRATRT